MIQIDMSMPTNCLDCPVCNEYLACAIPVNGRKWGENDVRDFSQSRPDWCPLKDQEARVLDWDELKDWGNVVWLEDKDEQACYIGLTVYIGTYYATFINVEPGKFHRFDVLYALYKKEFRCWSARPTIKQRQEVKWNE